jgi:hypothetical protein
MAKFNLVPQEDGSLLGQFQAKLVKEPSENTLTNTNGTNYKIVTVEFEDANGNTVQSSASIFEGNYSKGVTVGKTYLTTVRISADRKQTYLQMSHLENASRAEASAFGVAVVSQPAGVLAGQ